MKKMIRNASVWSGRDFVPANIFIDGKRISKVVPGTVQEQVEVINATGKFILPGIIDCHVHLSMNGGSHPMAELSKASEAEALFVAMQSCDELIKSGITTIRECGGKGNESVILANAVESGKMTGPRIVTCIKAIKIIGGHFVGMEVTGPVEATEAARILIKDGAKFIKLMATGGLGKIGEKPGVVELDVNEMRAAINEGKKHEMIGVAHCHSKHGMLNALEAGATSIEHATFVDKEVVEALLEKKAYVVPTFSPYILIDRHGLENGVSAYMCQMAKEICAYKNEHFKLVHESGVPIAFGRDAGAPFVQHGKYVLEMLAMEKCGMSRPAIIQSATENAAKLLGLWDDVGSLDAGKFADMVVLDADPAKDLAAFANVAMVFKEGTRVR